MIENPAPPYKGALIPEKWKSVAWDDLPPSIRAQVVRSLP